MLQPSLKATVVQIIDRLFQRSVYWSIRWKIESPLKRRYLEFSHTMWHRNWSDERLSREVLQIVYTRILNNYRVEQLAKLEENRLNCVDRIDVWFTLCSRSWSLRFLEDRSPLLGIIIRLSSFLERITCDYVKKRVAVIVQFYSRVNPLTYNYGYRP